MRPRASARASCSKAGKYVVMRMRRAERRRAGSCRAVQKSGWKRTEATVSGEEQG